MNGNPHRIEGTRLRILEVIMRPGRRPTWVDIARKLGVSTSCVHQHVVALRLHGLVTIAGVGLKRTIVPTCQFIPEAEL